MTTETKPKRCRKKPVVTPNQPPRQTRRVRGPAADLRHSEREHRRMCERGSRMLLAALARSAFKHDILLRDMSPDQQLAAARLDGWHDAVPGAPRLIGGGR